MKMESKHYWNYRLVKLRNDNEGWGGSEYAIHEVHYDKRGNPWAMTADPATFHSETPEGVIECLERALAAAKTRPVFDEPEEGKWPGEPPKVKR